MLYTAEFNMVRCFPTTNCDGGEWVNGTSRNDCCQHGVEPFGLSYTISGLEGCQLCPVGNRGVVKGIP